MPTICEELARYGVKIVQAGLVAGAGGNISARDGDRIWMKPSGLAMDETGPADFCGLDLASGRQTAGPHKPTSEWQMHLAVYRRRPDILALFHTHSPWASGVISSGATLQPMFAEFVCDLGRIGRLPYITPTTPALAEAVGAVCETADTLFLANHGILALGVTLKQAYFRCLVVEDAAKSQVAAAICGKPRFLTDAEQRELAGLDAARHRVRMMERA